MSTFHPFSYTSYIPEAELYSDTKGQLMTAMDRLLAGRIAEELIYGDALVSTRSKGSSETPKVKVKVRGHRYNGETIEARGISSSLTIDI